MPRITYLPKKFNKDHQAVINHANTFLAGFAAGGYRVTLRTLYYKFVKSNLIENTEKSYKRLSSIIGDARLAGQIDWDHLEDRMRSLDSLLHYDSPQDGLNALRDGYHIDMWAKQEWRPEVWIEKDALSGVIRGVCEENDVPFFCCRGYNSLSNMWATSMRLRYWQRKGYKPYIIHFGDHDPSGMDMSRDIIDRLQKTFGARFDFARVALNMDQIREHDCPPQWAKVTDSRYKKYLDQYGDESWELDALEPQHFRELVESNLATIRDKAQWAADLKEKAEAKARLAEVATEWEELPKQKALINTLTEEASYARLQLSNSEQAIKKLNETIADLRKRKKK